MTDVLTDDELSRLTLEYRPNGLMDMARAIIAAYQSKLRQGVELPEPDTEEPASNYFGKPCYYTEETLQQYGDARDQAGYLRGLEDAPAAQPDARKVIEQMVEELCSATPNLCDRNSYLNAIEAGQQWLAAAPAAQPLTDEQIRPAFEAMYRKLYPVSCDIRPNKFERDGEGDYAETVVNVAWNVWKAAHGIGADK